MTSNLQGRCIRSARSESQIWNSSLHSTESLLWSAEVSWGQRISALHSTYRFRFGFTGHSHKYTSGKSISQGCVTLVWKWGFLWFQCLRFESCWCQPMVTVTIYYASHFQNRWPYSGQFPLFTIHLACTLDSRPFIKAVRVAVC